MKPPFRFKQFDMVQDKSAMKIGTDGVLLGTWARLENAQTILDIGTGTGLIAIIASQRNQHAQVTALEIDKSAFDEAQFNINNCPWSKRIKILHISIQDYEPVTKFDHIICNPPFFINSKLTDPKSPRSFARQEIHLPPTVLAKKGIDLITDSGCLSVVYPIDRFKEIHRIFSDYGFYLSRKLTVYGRPNIPPKRVLLEWKPNPSKLIEEDIIIEEYGRHQYSEKFKQITKDFYLNF